MPENNKGKPKAQNPEARLQASLARDVSIRLMHEAAKVQADTLAVARWDNALATKDIISAHKRQVAAIAGDSIIASKAVKQSRRERLEALYAEDECKYGDELSVRKLAFRKDRI